MVIQLRACDSISRFVGQSVGPLLSTRSMRLTAIGLVYFVLAKVHIFSKAPPNFLTVECPEHLVMIKVSLILS